MDNPIPVLMYHSIAPEDPNWIHSYLSTDPYLFDNQIATLARIGYVSITLDDLYDYMSGRKKLAKKSVVLTFDDGYLDNWVFAFPILKKYGFKGTIFVSTDFIDPRDVIHPTLEDVWNAKLKMEDLNWKGFLCFREMHQLIRSGLMDIQCHCKTHTWYFVDPTIVDFHHPGDEYVWLAWNRKPERKYLWMEEDQSQFAPFGVPIYKYAKSLEARIFFPDSEVDQRIIDYVESRGGRSFFENPNWKQDLMDIASKFRKQAKSDRIETDQERRQRYFEEIVLSKEYLEAKLGKKVSFLCWPGGAYDELAIQIAQNAGYTAWTRRSSEAIGRKNRPGEDPRWIRRLGAAPWWCYKGERICAIDGEFLAAMLAHHVEVRFSGVRLKWIKLKNLLKKRLRGS